METKEEKPGPGTAAGVVDQACGPSAHVMADSARTAPSTGSRPPPNYFVTQRHALRPAMPEVKLEKPHLGKATLRRVSVADRPGGLREPYEVLTSDESGLAIMFARSLKTAIYGSVWYALEVQREPGGYFTIRRDEQGLERRLAVKRMPWRKINGLSHKEDPIHEIAALKKLGDPGHPHVLKLVEALDDGSTVYVLTPFVDGGEMFNWVETGASQEDVVKPLFRQLVEGMRYVHSKGICHVDMSLENALVDSARENAFIIDFGMSIAMPSDSEGRRMMSVPDTRLAKPYYCAPEALKQKAYDGVKVDVFSGGAMLFMMLTASPAFNRSSRADPDFWQGVCCGDFQGLLRHRGLPPLSDDVVDLLRSMMAYKPKDRLLPEEVLQHRWLRRSPPAAVTSPALAFAGNAVGEAREEPGAIGKSLQGPSPPTPPTESGVTVGVRDMAVVASEIEPKGTGQFPPKAEQPPRQKYAAGEDDNRTVLLQAPQQQAPPGSEPSTPQKQLPGAKPASIPPEVGKSVDAHGASECCNGEGTTAEDMGAVVDGELSPDGYAYPTE